MQLQLFFVIFTFHFNKFTNIHLYMMILMTRCANAAAALVFFIFYFTFREQVKYPVGIKMMFICLTEK